MPAKPLNPVTVEKRLEDIKDKLVFAKQAEQEAWDTVSRLGKEIEDMKREELMLQAIAATNGEPLGVRIGYLKGLAAGSQLSFEEPEKSLVELLNSFMEQDREEIPKVKTASTTSLSSPPAKKRGRPAKVAVVEEVVEDDYEDVDLEEELD